MQKKLIIRITRYYKINRVFFLIFILCWGMMFWGWWKTMKIKFYSIIFTASEWIFYLGLGFIVALCITFGAFFIHMKQKQKLPTYTIARTADNQKFTHEFQKKLVPGQEMNIRVNNYEFSPGMTPQRLLLPRSNSEHHYDEPQFQSR